MKRLLVFGKEEYKQSLKKDNNAKELTDEMVSNSTIPPDSDDIISSNENDKKLQSEIGEEEQNISNSPSIIKI